MASAAPAVSVVVPFYNGSEFLRACLESIFSQTFRDFEVLVVDDGSPEDPAPICAAFDVQLLRQENQGPSAARNLGIEHAQGEYIAPLDQDDAWEPGYLERCAAAMQGHPERVLVYSDCDLVDREGEVYQRRLLALRGGHPRTSLAHCLSSDFYVYPSCSFARRSAIVAAGGFDVRLRGWEDDDLWLRLYHLGEFHYIDEALVRRRVYRGSASTVPEFARSQAIYLRKLLATYPDRPEAGEYLTRDCIVPRFLRRNLLDLMRGLSPKDGRVDAASARRELRLLLVQAKSSYLPLWFAAWAPLWLLRSLVAGWRLLPLPQSLRERAWGRSFSLLTPRE